MLETVALKEQLRQAKEKLAGARRPRAPDVYSPDIRVWEMKLRLALEQNLELEQRLAWEIKQRNVAEKFIHTQIRHLQDMLEAVIETSPRSSPRRSSKSMSYDDRRRAVDERESLSPLLTEVMQVQLKFAETMQQLDHSVFAREKLLQSPPRRRKQESFASYSSESEASAGMQTFTALLDRETPSPARPTTQHASTSPLLTSSQHRDRVHLVQSQMADEDLTTPKIDRSIHFRDCDDEDDTPPRRYTPSASSSSSQPSTSLYSMCPSSDLDRSSFIADFAHFRQSLHAASRHSAPASPTAATSPAKPRSEPASPAASVRQSERPWTVDPTATLDELHALKQQLSLDLQSLSTELTLVSLDPTKSSRHHVAALQASVEECRHRLQQIDSRMRALVQ
ncbi:hypothetical protein ACHHYP_02209 [Achlya hypogyna]|uniref:Uncharacterized protein n=1 Tax=Achlya hypogyna TaxID=1202772 RepID=A0A1V9Z774_ACHHY|nr:hypothetical protein ACHHYP_02209 [Achlya hypogyna]